MAATNYKKYERILKEIAKLSSSNEWSKGMISKGDESTTFKLPNSGN